MTNNAPAVFNYANFSAMYPQLVASVNEMQAQMYWNQATLYVDNSCTSIIDNCNGQRTMILLMATAHICLLNASINGQPVRELVGRVSNASEGSVSVASEMSYPAGSSQWWMQSQPGASAYQAMARYRTMHYVPSCRGRRPGWY